MKIEKPTLVSFEQASKAFLGNELAGSGDLETSIDQLAVQIIGATDRRMSKFKELQSVLRALRTGKTDD